MEFIIKTAILFYLIESALSAICGGAWKGNTATYGSIDTTASRAFVVLDDTHVVDCYGVVSQVNVRCHNSGTVRFQVWRPKSGNDFTLVGEYSWLLDECENAEIILWEGNVNNGLFDSQIFTDTVADLSTQPCCFTGNWATSVTGYDITSTSTNDWQLCTDSTYATCETVGGSIYIPPGTVTDLTGTFNDNVYAIRRLGYERTLTIPNEWEYIPVQPGDRIGLAQQGSEGVVYFDSYASASSAGDEVRYVDGYSFPSAGTDVTFPTSNLVGRSYRLRFWLEDGMTPLHSNLPGTVQLAENVAVGTFVFDTRIKDWNYEEWMLTGDELEYTISTEGANFDIDSAGRITTAAGFDYETQEQYLVTVGVRDNPDRAWQDAVLTVDITDINEDIQNINLDAIVTFDAQDLITGFEVFDVDASSDSRTIVSDITSLQSLKYILVSSQPNDGAFNIDENNGKVTVTNSLVLTQNRRYTLQIAAAETDGTYTTGPKTLDIVINNVDQPPYITNLPETISIPEDTVGPLTIYTVYAEDPDGSTNTIVADLDLIRPYIGATQFTYAQVTGGLNADQDAYTVATTAAPGFDYESNHTYILPFYTTDTNFQSEIYYLKVEITDVNEAPVCNPSSYIAYIQELVPVGTIVGGFDFTVDDEDFGDTHTFQMAGNLANSDNRYFDIEGTKLVILNKIDLGLATERDYSITVEAVDSGGLSCTIAVTVRVMDYNQPHYITNLPRVVELNSLTGLNGDTVYTVTTEPEETNDVFTYTLGTPDPSDGLFTIDEKTGEITLTRDLAGWTYDGQPLQYNMTITVTDEHGISDGPKWLTVDISNPRYPPEIDNLPAHLTFVEPHGHKDFDLLLFTVNGVDSDGIGITEYEWLDVTPRLDEDWFVFDTITGQFYIKEDIYFNFEHYSNYTFTFRTKDDFHWSAPRTLTIEIIDRNEAPTFTRSTYSIELDEETPVGTVLALNPYNLSATDQDAGNTIYFETGYSWFRVSGDTLVVNHQFDRETETALTSFPVYVRDQSGLQDSGTVTLTYNDINDNAPVFRSSSYSATVIESAYGGTNVLKVTADDADLGQNKAFTYSVRDINNTAGTTYFQVHLNSGLIYVKHQLDYAKYPVVTFEVLATDKGNPQLTGTATVTINITDVNDVVPNFGQDFYNLDVPCDEPIGNTIVTVSASDVDDDATDDLSYFYLRFNRYYALQPQQGDVTVRETLECEKKDVMYILARDRNTTDGVSNVCVVRTNQYNPILYVVNIYLAVQIGDFNSTSDAFIEQLNVVISPWKAHIKEVRGEFDRNLFRKKRQTSQSTSTIVSVYATEHDLADSVDFLGQPRAFIPKETLLPILRKDISGTPQDSLKSQEFADFFVIKVEPQEENWFLDTAGGIVTTFFLTLLGLASVCVLAVFLYKKGIGKWWKCCKPRVRLLRVKRKEDPEPEGDNLFSLRYKHPEEYVHSKPTTHGVFGAIAALVPGKRGKRKISTPPSNSERLDSSQAGRDSVASYRTTGSISRAASPGDVRLNNNTPRQTSAGTVVHNVWDKDTKGFGQRANSRPAYGTELKDYGAGWRDGMKVRKPVGSDKKF